LQYGASNTIALDNSVQPLEAKEVVENQEQKCINALTSGTVELLWSQSLISVADLGTATDFNPPAIPIHSTLV